MNESVKQGTKYAGAALMGVLAGSQMSHTVKYELPRDSTIIYEDACGTDGTDPSKVYVVNRIPKGDGTFREVRIRKDQIK